MSESKAYPYHVKLDVLPRAVAATDKPGRRFQAHLKLRGKLTGKELTRKLAEEEFSNNLVLSQSWGRRIGKRRAPVPSRPPRQAR